MYIYIYIYVYVYVYRCPTLVFLEQVELDKSTNLSNHHISTSVGH